MDLRLPGGGSFLAQLIDAGHRSPNQDDDAVCANASPSDVTAALSRLFEGNIEYVGLHADIGWIQTADTGGGYVLERSLTGDDVGQFPSALGSGQINAAFLAYLAGDVNCGLDWSAAVAIIEPKPRRRWFRR